MQVLTNSLCDGGGTRHTCDEALDVQASVYYSPA